MRKIEDITIMFGFSYLEDKSKKYIIEDSVAKIIGSDFSASNHMIKKFENDKVFFDSNDFLIILDGVIINKTKIQSTLNTANWLECILQLYSTRGEQFFDVFRGSFSGVLRDKRLRKTIIFSDHIGTKILYYIQMGESLYVTSFMPNAYSFLKRNGMHCTMSIEGAYMLLCHGYMLDDYTICEQVKRIFPGHYLVIENSILQDKVFCRITNQQNDNTSIDESVEMIDSMFRKACEDEFQKDCEYSYEHLVSLSGGLDSRMTSLIADELGYKKQLNVTFSQSGYWDEVIPQQIVEDYHHDWIYKNLDSGYWLLDFEKIIKITGGNVLYYGQAHANSLFQHLDTSPFGLLHTGQLGDVFVGRTYVGSPEKGVIAPFKFSDRVYSTKFIDRLSGFSLKYAFENREMGILYNRGFNGMNNGIVCLYEKMETFSPFLDIDFINAALKLPIIWENKYLIYNKWIETKYPNLLNYGWEALNGHCLNEEKVKFLGRYYYKDEISMLVKNKILRLLGYEKTGSSNGKNHMNPIAYYIKNYTHINSVLDKYVLDNIEYVKNDLLKEDLKSLYYYGNGPEKTQAITLIATNKLFFM